MRIGFIFALLFIFSAKDLHAASISLSASSASINVGDELEVDASLSINAKDGSEYFLRGVFYRPGDNNYCGYTWNGNNYFSGPYSTNEGWKNFIKITVTNNVWTGKIKTKIDPEDSGCRNSGEYHFKIQRFTNSGGSTFDDQSEIMLQVNIPTPTPTPQPTPTPTPTQKPTKVPTATPTPKNSKQIVLRTTMSDEENVAYTKDILGSKNVYSANDKKVKISITPTSIKETQNTDRDKVTPIVRDIDNTADEKGGSLFVYLGGVSMLTSCGILLFRAYKNRNDG